MLTGYVDICEKDLIYVGSFLFLFSKEFVMFHHIRYNVFVTSSSPLKMYTTLNI